MSKGADSKFAEPGYAYIYKGAKLVRVETTQRREVAPRRPSSKNKAG
jgi:hypothetical protein